MDPNQDQQVQPPINNPQAPVNFLLLIIVALASALISSGATYLLINSQRNISQTKTVVQSPTPTPDLNREPTGSAVTANWKTYFNSKYGYYIKYPPTSKLDDKNSYKIWVDNQISIGVLSNPTNCLECPIIKKTENVNINGNPARKTTGVLSRGISYVDQSFMEYEIIHNNNHYYIKLYELSDDAARALYLTPDRIPKEIPQDKIQLFEQIASTFRFD